MQRTLKRLRQLALDGDLEAITELGRRLSEPDQVEDQHRGDAVAETSCLDG